MRTKRSIFCVAAVLLLSLCLCSSIFANEPQGRDDQTPIVRVDPSLIAVKSGEAFSVRVLIDPSSRPLSACLVNLSFDSRLIDVKKVTAGQLFGEGTKTEQGFPVIDKIHGVVKMSASSPAPQKISANNVFYTVDFVVKSGAAPGMSAVKIGEAKLTDEKGGNVPNVASEDGKVRIITLRAVQTRLHPITQIPERVTDIEDMPSSLKAGAVALTEKNVDAVYRNFLKEKQSFFAVKPEQLKLVSKEKTKQRWHIRYQQYYQGIPVYHATVGLTASEQGKVLAYGANFYPDIAISPREKISLSNAGNRVKKTLSRDIAGRLTQKDGEKIIYPVKKDKAMNYHLAWKFTLSGAQPNHKTDYVYIVDAVTGSVLHSYPVYGPQANLSGRVEGEIYPENPAAPPIATNPLKNSYVTLGAGTQRTTNANGNFSGTVAGANVNVTFRLEGPYAKVQDWVTQTNYTANRNCTGAACDQTWTAADRDHINVFYHINLLRDWYHNHCGYDWINAWDSTSQFKAQVNYNDNNAYAGSPMLFGSNNYARSSDIIYHECSHNVLYKIYGDYVGFNVDKHGEGYAFDEGFADYFACAMTNDSLHGEGAGGGRNLDNDIQYAGKRNYNTEGHSGGRIIAGAAWDLRTMLITEMGEAAGSQYADRLILEAHQTMASMPREYYFSDPQESNFLQSLYLADDDNANLADGVPHFPEIHRAFAHHDLLQAVLNQTDSYDVSTNTVGYLGGGDFYYSSGKFWANNSKQRGVKDLGDIGMTGKLDEVEIPDSESGYTRFGVAAVVGHTYVSLAQQGEEGNYIVFRVTWKSADSSQIAIEYFYRNNRIKLKNRDSYDFSQQLRGQLTGGDFYLTQLKFYANNAGQTGVLDLGNIGSLQLDRVSIPESGYTRFGVTATTGHTYVAKAQQGEEGYYVIFRVHSISGTSATIDYIYRMRNRITFYNGNSYDFSQQTRGQYSGGDFYLTGLKFYANNSGQTGVKDLGAIGNVPLASVAIPESGYTRFGVSATNGHTYVAKAQQGEEGGYIVFRVAGVAGTSVTVDYLYVTPNRVSLNDKDSFDFSTQTKGQITGGDLYLSGVKFWANNQGQRGLKDLGNIGNVALKDVEIPASGYYRFGTVAAVGHTYVSLAQQGEEEHHIIFRVNAITGTDVNISFLYK